MSKRLRQCLVLCALMTALTMCVMVIGGMYVLSCSQMEAQLARQAAELSAQLAQTDDPVALLAGSVFDLRVTLIGPDGQVRYDSGHNVGNMENHLLRPEVAQALAQGTGSSRRQSDTVGEISLYYALRLSDGSVLRVAGTQRSILGTVQGVALWAVGGAMLCVLAAAALAVPVTRRMVRPINGIDLEHPLESDAYEELSPVLRRMDHQNTRIAAQMEAMAQQRRQQDAILGGMREGLVILDDRHTVLTMNAAARELLAVRDEPEGRPMLAVHRGDTLVKLLEQGGGQGETSLSGRTVHLSVSRVEQGGMVILLQDVTSDRLAEESRRQFSANVSHELRTPLTTISGYAELLSSGLVKAEDAEGVGGKILQESRRLLSLIEDIIRLSRLDEGVTGEHVAVELHRVAEGCVSKLRPAAEAAKVTLTVQGEPAWVTGDPAQIEEMLTNLIENGVKYNVAGGEVDVTTGMKQGAPFASVRDTGVGIAPEHQTRVFERFYRVDKSRSKQTGGTGLGLSIVKHAAQAHHADISLTSKVGQGTCVTLTFPSPRAD
ncbi:MAG: ATP-binding protein [Aristaeellaceae bacterium]